MRPRSTQNWEQGKLFFCVMRSQAIFSREEISLILFSMKKNIWKNSYDRYLLSLLSLSLFHASMPARVNHIELSIFLVRWSSKLLHRKCTASKNRFLVLIDSWFTFVYFQLVESASYSGVHLKIQTFSEKKNSSVN